MQYWIECVDSFDYEPYGRQGPFALRSEAESAREAREAEISRKMTGGMTDRVYVYNTDDPDGEPRQLMPYTVRTPA